MSHAEIALALAAEGISIFPCHSAGDEAKRPMPGVFWRNQSTTDAGRIEAWWRRWPDAAIGIDLAKSGLLVIDCDKKPGRPDGVDNFEKLGHDLSTVPTVATPSGGRHYYFRQSFDPPHGNGKGTLPPGIDVRGHGGYVIAPGCQMEAGNYVSIVSADPPEPPPWLVGILRPLAPRSTPPLPHHEVSVGGPSPYGQAVLQREYDRVCAAPCGARNETINDASFRLGQLAPNYLTVAEITAAMENAARSWGVGPKDKVFGKNGTIARGIAAGMEFPRGPEKDNHVRELVVVDDWFMDTATGEFLEEPPIPSGDIPDAILNDLPGVLGDIVQWLVASSEKPQPALALAAAITVIGTAAGRHVAGPTLSGTHLYIVGLAKTGYGKDHALSAIPTILQQAGMGHHVGAGEFMSYSAAIDQLVTKPLALSAMDEFGAFLKRINNKRAGGFEAAISKVIREPWGKSFKPYLTPKWASKESVMVLAPCQSIYGVSTPEEFYSALSSGDTSNGFLNRFLVIEARTKPKMRKITADPTEVPDGIIDALKAIYTRQGDLVQEFLNDHATAPPRDTLAWATPDAEERRLEFAEQMEDESNAHPERANFLVRTAEMAVRLATIRAVAADPAAQSVSRADMEWGIALARYSAETMIRGVGDNMSENDFQSNYKLVLGYIKERGKVNRKELYAHINGRFDKRVLDSILSSLSEAGEIEECKLALPEGARGRPPMIYMALARATH